MKSAGVKFFDFTTKHHEGFSMYDTNTRVHGIHMALKPLQTAGCRLI